MNLINNHCIHSAKRFRCLRCKQQIERLRRSDENFRGMAGKARPLTLWGITGTHADLGFTKRNAHAPRHVSHARQRRAEIALHVHSQRLQRGDIHDSAALLFLLRLRLQHQAVETPKECGQGFAGSGRSQNQCALSTSNHGPAHALRRGWCVKNSAKPLRGHRMKAREWVRRQRWNRCKIGVGRAGGHESSE